MPNPNEASTAVDLQATAVPVVLRRPAGASEPTSARRLPLRWLCLGLWGFGGALAACTLTSDDYRPVLLQTQSELEPDAGAPPDTCPAGAACCDALPCAPGLVCLGASCVPSGGSGGAPACTGTDCQTPIDLPLTASCNDKLVNQDETDLDCGGTCGSSCVVGQRCQADADCQQGSFCSPQSARCESASCADGLRNGSELLADCGGGECAGCPDGTLCQQPVDCNSGVCGADNRCAAPACNDAVKNQNELDVDCGGVCRGACEAGSVCASGGDCQSGVCGTAGCAEGLGTCCQAPTCNDRIANGDEPVVDCGNLACGRCGVGTFCTANLQCQSGLCQFGRCTQPNTCNDTVLNGTETSVDCGGGRCPRCPPLSRCLSAADCTDNNCDSNGVCISCGDGAINGSETDFDCGGADPFCVRCLVGQRCASNTDCVTTFCVAGICAPPA